MGGDHISLVGVGGVGVVVVSTRFIHSFKSRSRGGGEGASPKTIIIKYSPCEWEIYFSSSRHNLTRKALVTITMPK
jgi:hypothetical protein